MRQFLLLYRFNLILLSSSKTPSTLPNTIQSFISTVTMPSPLETLPTEVIELIVRLLPLKDIRSLRLACRTLSDKSSESHFKTFFYTQHVVMTADALRELTVNVQAGGFRSCVRRLCLVGVADKEAERTQTSKLDPRQEEMTSLLTQTYNGLAKHHSVDSLLSLSLELRVVKNDLPNNVLRATTHLAKSRTVWQCAIDVFDQSLRALAASTLKLKHLNIFNGPNMENCSLPSEQLSMINWSDPGLADSLSTLTSLSVNISTPIFLCKTLRDPSGDGLVGRSLGGIEAAQEERNFGGLAKVLAACPRLEDLDLRYHRIITQPLYHDWEVLQRVAGLQTLPVLNRLSISGFTAKSPDLLNILERTKPRELCLGPIALETGTFHSIFDYCSSRGANIFKASFERLVQMSHQDGAGVVHFVSQCPKVPVVRNRSPSSAFQAPFCSEFAEFEHLDQGARISCHLDRSGFIGMPQYGGCPPSRRQDHLNNFF
ncbi:hypothetical protein NCS57_00942600 [Fusarium keratoplasticum]|uniref:Uncharacterized protein n=1 Tax=Fusarium keratoplasticum TaxID=1328300 RepID=A0ACC0QT20_9HYPO|nr:hypothetical protein NCS57_00942600 [Fusarium keratoplasticum]KAI8663418.1 hypothetical protein NCS57_00942600 [Fusarium keratoplasticum]KAI8664106.1 hypothetical protein NCS55_00917800 [Fusarium keratoplasticum]